jgi:hypothetical protein
VADWHWGPVTDDLLDGLPPAALAAVRVSCRRAIANADLCQVRNWALGLRGSIQSPLRHRPSSDLSSLKEQSRVKGIWGCE